MLLCAGAVLSRGLDSKTGLGAGGVEVAVVIHTLLERVGLPAEDVVTVGSSATGMSQPLPIRTISFHIVLTRGSCCK